MKVSQLLLVLVLVNACMMLPKSRSSRDYLFKIEGNPVSTDEFLYNLDKNNYDQDSIIREEEIREYLNMYINFKLKVFEARQIGLDTTKSFRAEYKKYIDQLAESFLKDDSMVNVLVKEAYEHLKTEINASHILIKVENPANPADTLRAYQKIYQVYEKVKSGEDFNKLALEYSEDPSAKFNNGNLGYFTGMQMVYPFEKAAYSTSIGQVSLPFKTRFGYHILKVNDQRPARGKIQVAHIMLRLNNNANKTDSIRIKNQIESIHDSLLNGGDWDYFCNKYSQDINTRNNGGILQPFEAGRVVPGFSEPAFALINPGDISQPVLTPYGWHIIKLIKKIPLQTFEEMKEELTSRIKQDSRSETGKEMLIGKLKKDNHFSFNEEIRDMIMAYADSSLVRSQWKFDDQAPFLDSTLFSINHKNYKVIGFFNFVRTHQKMMRNVDPVFYFNQLLQEYINQEIIQYEKDHLADKYFEYRMLSREYEEGILLFEIMDQKIWSFSMEDTAGLERFYRQNIENYQWDTRLKAVIFKTRDLSMIDKIRHLLEKPYYDLSADPIIFEIPDEGLNNTPFANQLDSLYREVIKNEDWLIEMTLSDNTPLQIYSFLNDKNYIPDKFIIKSHGTDKNLLKIVSKSKKDLDKSISDKSGVNLQIESGIYQNGDNTLVDMIDWVEGIHDLSIEEDEYLIYVEKVLPPMDQELEEIKGKVISDYQNYLDKMWVQELREKYKVEINDQALNHIIDQFEK